jgi:uncharacterized caspase-like protein
LAIGNVALPAAADERRVALVIGNGTYQHAPVLTNPARDANAIAELLKSAQFDTVELSSDLSLTQMRRALRDFSSKAAGADIAIVYYAGHGIEVDGRNYLIPVDAKLEQDIDVEDEAVSLDRVYQVLDSVKRLRIILLDACRDNPFVKDMKRTIAKRAIGRGLAPVDVTSSDTLVAYAAKAGSTAADGSGSNSPFAKALLDHLTTPGLDVRLALGRVRDSVLEATDRRQEPFIYGSLGGRSIVLNGGAATSDGQGSSSASSAQSSAALMDLYKKLSEEQASQNKAQIDSLRAQIEKLTEQLKADARPAPAPAPPSPSEPTPEHAILSIPPSGSGASLWNHNGSVISLEASGKRRVFRYHTPRAAITAEGVRQGTVLFEGTTDGKTYRGTAYRFSAKCGRRGYTVSGPILDNFRRVVLLGTATRIDDNCRVTDRSQDELDFTYMRMD